MVAISSRLDVTDIGSYSNVFLWNPPWEAGTTAPDASRGRESDCCIKAATTVVADKNKITAAAQKYTARGQFEKAIAEYRKLVKEDPNDIRTWLKMGDLYTRMGARKEATETYLRVADHYKKSGFHLKAVAVYKQVIKLDPMLAEVYELLAEAYMSLGLTSEALIQLEQLAEMFQRSGNSERALATLTRMADLDPQNITTRLRIAEQHSKDGNGAEAVRHFSEACDLLKRHGRMDDYVKVAERLLFHDPTKVLVAREAAAHYLEKNHPKRALAKLQLCFAQEPRNVETLNLLAQAFCALGQPDKAVSVYNEVAAILGQQNRENERRAVFEKIALLDPKNAGAAAALRGSSPAQGAQPQPRKAISGLPSPAEAVARTAITPPAASVAPPAEDLTEEGLAAKAEKLLAEADVLVKYGLVERAREHFTKIFEFDYYNLDARERLRDLLLRIDDRAGAIEQLFILTDGFVEEQPEGAVYFLHQILGIDPQNLKAREILRRIGGVMPDGLEEPAPQERDAEPTQEVSVQIDGLGETTDKFEISGMEPAPGAVEDLDIDEELPPPPRPSLPRVTAPPPERVKRELPKAVPAHVPAPAPPPAPVPVPAAELADISAELEEIEFFISQGLVEDAVPILNELSERYPGDPRVKKLLAETSGSIAPAADVDKPTVPPPTSLFDFEALAGNLDLDLEDVTQDDISNEIDKVFSQFKAGVEKQVSRTDSTTHFDLGSAYRDMALYEDAIAEFRIAAEDPSREVDAATMIGMCQASLGRLDEALATFQRALGKPRLDESARLALMYETGKVYESQGRKEDALKLYNAILAKDPGFADVVDRIDAMEL
jgi:tetratricopeptide (TPR) repeat protein